MCILVVGLPRPPPTPPVFTIATHACGGSMCLNGRRINHGNIVLPAFAASDVKTSRKAPLLLQRAKRLRIVSNFLHTFSGISPMIVRVLLPSWHSL